jgi:hypothetical protein
VMLDSFGASTVLAVAVGGAALLLIPDRPRLARRRGTSTSQIPPDQEVTAGSRRRAVVGAMALTGAGLVIAPGLWWAILPAAVITGLVLSRRPVGRTAAQRGADRRIIAVQAELLAACLDAGMAVGPALRAVSAVLTDRGPPDGSGVTDGEGPLALLESVSAMLSLGADPHKAWRAADLDPDLAPMGAAARRSASGGGGLAQAVREHAAQLRQDTAAASARAAGRAGVLMTAPLGVCFLPAFLCLGLAPVVVGLLGQLSID